MVNDEAADTTIYVAVVNGEEQFSIWPAALAMPNGWREAGMRGAKDECLRFIEEHWVDMRPKSLRARLVRG